MSVPTESYTPPSKIRKENSPLQQFKSKILKETARCSWEISDFDNVRQSDELILSQKLEFNTISDDGLKTTKCVCYLHNYEKDWIACSFKVLESKDDDVNVSFTIEIKEPNGEQSHFTLQNPIAKAVTNQGRGCGMLISRTANINELPLVDGTLTILFEFNIYTGEKPEPVNIIANEKLKVYELAFLRQLSQDWDKCRDLDLHSGDNIATIVSNDGEEFKVNKLILSARSVVFQRMFQTQMKESETSIVTVDDVSSKVLTVLLEYIVAAKLHKDWKDDDVFEELIYAAHKYKLDLLVDFLDVIMINVCTKENAKRFALLAQKMDMKKAQVDLFSYIKYCATTLEDLTLIPDSSL